MTQIEFEGWVSDNYAALARMANRVTSTRGSGSIDALHDLLESYCDGSRKLPGIALEKLKPGFLAMPLIAVFINNKKSAAIRMARLDEFATESAALGLGVTMTGLSEEEKHLRHLETKRQARRARSVGPVIYVDPIWVGGLGGDDRRRYQQRRDNRLYDGQAAQSLGEHIRGRSSRSLHGAGRSLVHHGEESAMDPREMDAWRTEVKAYKEAESWCWVSCSTGYQFHGKKWIGQDSPGTFAMCGGCSEHAISGRHDNACALRKGAA